MPVPKLHISDNATVRDLAQNSNAILKIKSAVSDIYVQFPAFLTDFSQTFDATWNTEEVFGRMDPIATYQGTKRTMSLGFDIPSGNKAEAKNNLIKVQNLVKTVYPVYNNNALSKPPLVRLQFANLIKSDFGDTVAGAAETTGDVTPSDKATNTTAANEVTTAEPKPAKQTPNFFGLLGWISGLSWKPNLEMGMFTQDGELLPKAISISFSFNVLHEKTLSQESSTLNNWPFGVN